MVNVKVCHFIGNVHPSLKNILNIKPHEEMKRCFRQVTTIQITTPEYSNKKHVDFAPNNEDMIRYVSAKLVSDQNMGM